MLAKARALLGAIFFVAAPLMTAASVFLLGCGGGDTGSTAGAGGGTAGPKMCCVEKGIPGDIHEDCFGETPPGSDTVVDETTCNLNPYGTWEACTDEPVLCMCEIANCPG